MSTYDKIQKIKPLRVKKSLNRKTQLNNTQEEIMSQINKLQEEIERLKQNSQYIVYPPVGVIHQPSKGTSDPSKPVAVIPQPSPDNSYTSKPMKDLIDQMDKDLRNPLDIDNDINITKFSQMISSRKVDKEKVELITHFLQNFFQVNDDSKENICRYTHLIKAIIKETNLKHLFLQQLLKIFEDYNYKDAIEIRDQPKALMKEKSYFRIYIHIFSDDFDYFFQFIPKFEQFLQRSKDNSSPEILLGLTGDVIKSFSQYFLGYLNIINQQKTTEIINTIKELYLQYFNEKLPPNDPSNYNIRIIQSLCDNFLGYVQNINPQKKEEILDFIKPKINSMNENDKETIQKKLQFRLSKKIEVFHKCEIKKK